MTILEEPKYWMPLAQQQQQLWRGHLVGWQETRSAQNRRFRSTSFDPARLWKRVQAGAVWSKLRARKQSRHCL